jgi:alkylation response protein AidB-like acyl-CoA dehydrogenase
MYRLTEEQQRITQRVAAVADDAIAPHAARVDKERTFPGESLAALGGAGLLGLTVPAAYGGLGQGLRTTAAALDEIAQRCSSTAMVYLMHVCGGAAFGGAHRLERLYRDARAPIVMAPTSDQAYDFIGRALCGLEVF